MDIEGEFARTLAEWDAVSTDPELWRIDMFKGAAAVLMPLVKRAQAEAWERGAKDMMRAVSEEQTVSFIAPHNPYIENEGAGT